MSLWKRPAAVAGMVAALTLTLAVPAAAHVTVNANSAVQGGYAKLTFRVPNESDTASTTKVEVNLPADAPFASVSLKPVAGWTMAPVKSKLAKPIEAHGTQLTEAVSKITWTAAGDAAIKPGQFQEFDVSVGPLPQVPQVVFKALQTYSDGTVVRWIDEPTTDGSEPEKPAPVLKLTAAAAATGTPAAGSSAAPVVTAVGETGEDGGSSWTGYLGIGLGLVALVLGLLAYRRSGGTGSAPGTAPSSTAPSSTTASGTAASDSAASDSAASSTAGR